MINVFAPINNLGYGIHSCSMIKAFEEEGIDINLTPIGQVQEDPYFTQYWRQADDRRRNSFDRMAPSLHIFHSEYANQFCGSPMVNFAVFETTKIADDTKRILEQMDMLFTTTEDHRNILIENGITVPIHVVHEGVDPNVFNYNPNIRPYIKTDKFTYITVGKNEKRKNTSMIVKSFIETMQYKEAALICHTFDPFTHPKLFEARFLPQYTDIDVRAYGFTNISEESTYTVASNGICDIYFTKQVKSCRDMAALYASAHVGIAVSRAEGWDLPAMEMMATGKPVIISNTLGHKEYLEGVPEVQSSLIINPTGMEVAEDGKWFQGDRGDWATIDKDDVIEMIEDTYDDMDTYIAPYQSLSSHFCQNYDWKLAAKQVASILY